MTAYRKLIALKRKLSSALPGVVVAILATVLAGPLAHAQADFEKGYQGFQSYHGSDFDTVNLANGNLVLDIPLLSYEQRGGLPPIVVSIRSNSTTFQSTPPYINGPLDTQQHEVPSGVIGAPWGQPHVSISPGGLSWKEDRIVTASKTAGGSPEYLTRFVAIDDSGATHSLGEAISNSTAGYIPGIRYSVDGSGLMLQPGTSATGPVLVDRKGNTGGLIDPNGNAIHLQGPCATYPGSGDYFDPSLPSWEGYAHGTASAKTITDSIGRVIPNPSYLPPLTNYSCLVDLSASYHAASTDVSCGIAGAGSALPSGSALYGETFQFPGEGGTTIPLTFCYDKRHVSARIPQPDGENLLYPTVNEQWWLLSSVTLPNGTQWVFTYDVYGQVASVTMPTGAVVSYTYATRLACGNPPGVIPVYGTPVWPYSNILSSRMVATRTLAVPNGTTQTWTYTNEIGSGWAGGPPAQTGEPYYVVSPGKANAGTVTVADPLGNETVHTFALQGGSTCGPYETDVTYRQGASTVLKEVATLYSTTGTDYANPTNFSNYIAVGVFPKQVTTTVANQVRQDLYKYDGTFGSYQDYLGNTHHFSFGLVQSEMESDWGNGSPGSILRTHLHTRLWQSNWKYYAANLIDLPCLDTVLTGSYSGTQTSCTPPTPPSSQASQTYFAYDQTAMDNCPNSLGLPTAVTRWLSSGTNPVALTYYCSAWSPSAGMTSVPSAVPGMPQAKKDANGNSTAFTYDASGLYLSAVQHPYTGVAHIEYPTYDDATGLLLQHKDENGQTTKYQYDAMRRPISIGFPDGGSESYCFVDTSSQSCGGDSFSYPSFTYSKVIDSTHTYFAVGQADGLGRMIHTQVATADPAGWINADTAYDALGRVASATNPYISTDDSSYGVTVYNYDALNRKTVVVNPDGTSKQWCYNSVATDSQSNCYSSLANNTAGTWVDSADELGNDWRHVSDGLGRLKQVLEPNGLTAAPALETDYAYNTLDNLTAVTQWGGTSASSGADGPIDRSFSYDTLGRLTSSTNPEVGTAAIPSTAYTYDANGNLIEKIAPAVNVPAASATSTSVTSTCYFYDALDRLTAKYPFTGSGTCASPPSTYKSAYAYDGQLLSGTQFSSTTFALPVGHLTDEQQFSGTTLVSERSPYSFDSMGRMLAEQQSNYAPAATPYVFTHTYDYAGDLLTTMNSLTNIDILYNFDETARLQGIRSSLTGSGSTTYPQWLYSVGSYSAVGVATASYGSASPSTAIFNLFRYYDRRQRVVDNEVYPLADTFATASVTVSGTENECVTGSGSSCNPDAGTLKVTAGTAAASVATSASSTANSVATALAAWFNQDSSVVNATVVSTGTNCTNGVTVSTPVKPCAVIDLTAVQFGIYGNVNLTTPSGTSVSFTAVANQSALTGGAGSPQGGNTAYNYTVSYSKNGNVAGANDTYNGSWTYTNDTLNRIASASYTAYEGTGVTTPNGVFDYQCWAYDNFGNRTNELESSTACPTALTNGTSTHWAQYAAGNNRISQTDLLSTGPVYDAAGNILQDANNQYRYDLEGRLCAVFSSGPTYTQYVYDAGGQRVAKGTLTAFPASDSACAAPIAANNFTLTATYLRGIDSDQDTELDTAANAACPNCWHTNVFAAGETLATYNFNGVSGTAPTLSFNFEDWEGTKRMQSTAAGAVAMHWSSDPFGDYLHPTAIGSATDATENHFTGKERDAESGNDYFGARYYSSAAGRWLSPDKAFADQHLANPQSWNLYEYGWNNPLRMVDSNGQKVNDGELAAAKKLIQAYAHDHPGGTFYIDFEGIKGPGKNPGQNPRAFDGAESNHSAANSIMVQNEHWGRGLAQAFWGMADTNESDTGIAIYKAARDAGLSVGANSHSNGVNALGKLSDFILKSGDQKYSQNLTTVRLVEPDTMNPWTMRSIDNASNTTVLTQSNFDPALAVAGLGSQSPSDWQAFFPSIEVQITNDLSHDLGKNMKDAGGPIKSQ